MSWANNTMREKNDDKNNNIMETKREKTEKKIAGFGDWWLANQEVREMEGENGEEESFKVPSGHTKICKVNSDICGSIIPQRYKIVKDLNQTLKTEKLQRL